ncbi:MAG: hypothetical protein DHS20C12_15990 [Pseudohongiella sp.]|nr:MAG: hypothetical protein DHS20C12_15990 [Pseudohongiella sp.]
MKIYGRAQTNELELELLEEASIVADPSVLRELASFLYRCADAIEEQPTQWEADQFDSSEVSGPSVIAFNPNIVNR